MINLNYIKLFNYYSKSTIYNCNEISSVGCLVYQIPTFDTEIVYFLMKDMIKRNTNLKDYYSFINSNPYFPYMNSRRYFVKK
jgi:hypothetical protein